MVWQPLETKDVKPYTRADKKAGLIPRGKKVGELPQDFYVRQSDIMMALDPVMRVDLSGLNQFYRRWGLGFPIPPNVEIVLDDIMDDPWTRSVKINRKGDNLVLLLDPRAGRQTAIGFVEGALWHYLPLHEKKGLEFSTFVDHFEKRHSDFKSMKDDPRTLSIDQIKNTLRIQIPMRDGKVAGPVVLAVMGAVERALPKRSNARFQDRSFYESVLKARDCRNDKLSYLACAKRIWPERDNPETDNTDDVEYPVHLDKGKDGVRNLLRTFEGLARTFNIPL